MPAPPGRRTRRKAIVLALLALATAGVWLGMRMPGSSHTGPLPALDAGGQELARELERHVRALAEDIGERNTDHPQALERAAQYVAGELGPEGVGRQRFVVRGVDCQNLWLELPGKREPNDVVVVGAHYDSAPGTPGADDNASGVAALLWLAGRLRTADLSKTVRLEAFVNEEPPFFKTDDMGSLRSARALAERGARVTAMLSLETIGYYSEAEGSQKYPAPLGLFYPSRGDFIGFVGNVKNRALVRRALSAFRAAEPFPSEGAALPGWLPGIDWSDHWSFWQVGYPAIMVTDTAPFRNPAYHHESDVAGSLDYARMARVVRGLEAVVIDLAGG